MASTTARVALITGCSASGGLGLSTALRLAKDPENRFKVYATMRNLDKKASLETKGKGFLGKTLLVRQLDVCSDKSVDQTVQEIIKTEGRVDVLINNAGVALQGILEHQDMELIKNMFEVNFFGAVRLTKAVLPGMKANNSGHIINVSSTSGICGAPFLESYSASKFALEGFTESLALVLKEFNIKSSIIEPGPMMTHFRENGEAFYPDRGVREYVADEKTRRLNDTADQLYKAIFTGPNADQWLEAEDDVAQTILNAILSEKPHLRYQTSERQRAVVKSKLIDPTGDDFVNSTNQMFFSKK